MAAGLRQTQTCGEDKPVTRILAYPNKTRKSNPNKICSGFLLLLLFVVVVVVYMQLSFA
jgi:hypothetical protein